MSADKDNGLEKHTHRDLGHTIQERKHYGRIRKHRNEGGRHNEAADAARGKQGYKKRLGDLRRRSRNGASGTGMEFTLDAPEMLCYRMLYWRER